MTKIISLFLLAISLLATPAVADTFSFPLEGRLTETNGKPVDGPVALSVAFYHVATGGTAVVTLTDGLEHVALQEGVLQLRLTFSASDYHNIFSSVIQRVFVEITDLTHAPTTPYPRYEIGMTPYAGKIPVDNKTITFGSDGKASLAAAGAATSGRILSADGSGGLAWIDAPAATASVSSGGQNGAFSIGTNDASAFTLETNNSPRMTIDAAGKVAFGTATTSGGDTTFSQLANGDTMLFAKRRTDSSPTGKFLDFKNAANSSSLFSVDVDGNATFAGIVGIGTTLPAYTLDVRSIGHTSLSIDSPTGKTSSVNFTKDGGTIQWVQSQAIDGVQNPLVFSSAAKQGVLALNSFDGNVGIGTTSPTAPLHIQAANDATLLIQSGGESRDAHLVLSKAEAVGAHKTGIVAASAGGGNAGTYSRANLHFVLNSAADSSAYTLGTDTKMMIRNDGNVGIGTTSPSGKFNVVSSGTSNLAVYDDGSVLAGTYVSSASNIAPNSEFASALTGWTSLSNNDGSTQAWQSGASGDGSSGYLRFNIGAGPSADRFATNGAVVTGSTTYHISFWYRTSGITGGLYFFSTSDTGTMANNTSYPIPLSSSWTYTSFSFTTGAGSGPYVGFYKPGNIGTGFFDVDHISITTAGGATSPTLTLSSSGTVGIGNSSGANKLDVNGSASFGSYAGTSAPSGGLLVSGNVGIGTTTPTARLEVDGGVKITQSAPATPAVNTAYSDSLPKAWLRFDGSNQAVAASFNVASVVRAGSGRYTVTWATPFASGNYAVMCSAMRSGVAVDLCAAEGYSTSSVQIDTNDLNNSTVDSTLISVFAFGGQ